ncbi:MAG TPA: sulfotransferase [Oscillatoriaceae cyanobacterium M33_DOE_052]|uniref:Sulfotransferase n=1 Tax=Planktothricoides sp. SpSt-374 TaxID=2282167 RepID=A0A7C3ZSF4_9CYAN|nr:sulfotransferase [Oscillatoriaceae cyanobacterium M33_DOE_052]
MTKNIFIVGCPRSGTTLLQSILAAHSDIASFPETKFFPHLVPGKEPWKSLGMVSRRFKPYLYNFLVKEIGHPELLANWPPLPFIKFYSHRFAEILTILAAEQGKSIWLEKTPEHRFYINEIENHFVGVKIIHLLRSGADVVASLYEVTHKYPHLWHGKWDVDLCVDMWLEAVEISRRHLGKNHHIFVQYEQLVEQPQAVAEKLSQFLGIDFQSQMLANYGDAAKTVSLAAAGRTVSSEIRNANSQKFYQVFTPEQQEYVLKRLSGVSLDDFVL